MRPRSLCPGTFVGYYVTVAGARMELPADKQEILKKRNTAPQDVTLGRLRHFFQMKILPYEAPEPVPRDLCCYMFNLQGKEALLDGRGKRVNLAVLLHQGDKLRRVHGLGLLLIKFSVGGLGLFGHCALFLLVGLGQLRKPLV